MTHEKEHGKENLICRAVESKLKNGVELIEDEVDHISSCTSCSKCFDSISDVVFASARVKNQKMQRIDVSKNFERITYALGYSRKERYPVFKFASAMFIIMLVASFAIFSYQTHLNVELSSVLNTGGEAYSSAVKSSSEWAGKLKTAVTDEYCEIYNYVQAYEYGNIFSDEITNGNSYLSDSEVQQYGFNAGEHIAQIYNAYCADSSSEEMFSQVNYTDDYFENISNYLDN